MCASKTCISRPTARPPPDRETDRPPPDNPPHAQPPDRRVQDKATASKTRRKRWSRAGRQEATWPRRTPCFTATSFPPLTGGRKRSRAASAHLIPRALRAPEHLQILDQCLTRKWAQVMTRWNPHRLTRRNRFLLRPDGGKGAWRLRRAGGHLGGVAGRAEGKGARRLRRAGGHLRGGALCGLDGGDPKRDGGSGQAVCELRPTCLPRCAVFLTTPLSRC